MTTAAHMTKTLKRNIVHTLPMREDAQRALTRWLIEHNAELNAVLAPFGLDGNDVPVPAWRILCTGCAK